jgi:hypothetical protein
MAYLVLNFVRFTVKNSEDLSWVRYNRAAAIPWSIDLPMTIRLEFPENFLVEQFFFYRHLAFD